MLITDGNIGVSHYFYGPREVALNDAGSDLVQEAARTIGDKVYNSCIHRDVKIETSSSMVYRDWELYI